MKNVWKRQALRQGQVFLRTVVPAVVKPARTIWNEFIAFLFLCFSAIFGFKTARLAMDYAKAQPGEGFPELLRLAVAGFCTLVMVWFGVASYLRARKISRS